MRGNEILVDPAGLDDVVGDGVEQIEVALRLEHHADIGQVERAMLECRQHRDADMRRTQPPVGDTRPQDRQVCISAMLEPPQHERIRGLNVVIIAAPSGSSMPKVRIMPQPPRMPCECRALGSILLLRKPALLEQL